MEDNETNREPPDPILSPPDCETITTTVVPNDDADLDNKGQRKPKENTDGGGIPQTADIELKGNKPEPRGPKISGKEQEIHTVPDGGYGWFIVLGSFISHIIIGGLERSAGIYFLEFQKKFDKSAQLTAWPSALWSALRSFLGPLAGILCSRYSVRSVCLVGSIFRFAGLLLNVYAPDFFFLFFSHSLLQGIGSGLVFAPSVNIVGMYFDKRRGIASGISASGVGIGTFVLVPVAQMLFDTYGYQGAFMILAGISLNAAVSAMLYRPLSLLYKFQGRKENKKANGTYFSEDNFACYVFEDTNYVEKQGEIMTEVKKEDESFKTVTNKDPTIPLELAGNEVLGSEQIISNTNNSILSLHHLRNPSFLMFVIGNMLFTTSIKSFFTFIPPLVTSLGFSESEGAFVLSIFGVADTIGPIVFGFLFDLGPFRPIRAILFTGITYSIAIVSILLPFFENYIVLCSICAMYGILTGTCISLKCVIAIDILGVANISSSFGILIFFQAIGICIGPPLSGALKDITGSYTPLYYMNAGLMLCAGFLMLGSNIFLWRQRRREEEEAQKKKTANDTVVTRL